MGPTKTPKLAMPLFFMVLVLLLLSSSQISCQTVSSSNLESGRNLIEVENLVRQSDDTVRVDPLNKLKKYRGGYDITNIHYWSSTVYTGIHGYVLGVLWLLCGLVYGIYHVATTWCCTSIKNDRKLKKRSPCHKQCYLLPALLAAFFTILAITATGLVLGGNAKFHSRAKTVVDIIIDTANNASDTIYNTTGAMKEISGNMGVYSSHINYFIELGCVDCPISFWNPKTTTRTPNVDHTMLVTHSPMLVVLRGVFLPRKVSLTSFLPLNPFIGSIARASIAFARAMYNCECIWYNSSQQYYALTKRFEGDTCKALEDFQLDPYNNSLSSILPCDELLSARPVLSDISRGIYRLINEVNANLTGMQANSYLEICNPFSAAPEYSYQPQNCPSNSIRIGDIPKALKLVTCVEDASTGTCNGGIYMSTRDFNSIKAYTNSVQTLINAYPGMESLVECQTVTDAFSVILYNHCKPLKRYTRMVWAGLVFLSTVMVALVLLWITESHHEQESCYSNSSVKPHYGTESAIESGDVKVVNSDKDTEFGTVNKS
ncbi:hypothetical protein LguiA_002792 [Lonicera macranthoides]